MCKNICYTAGYKNIVKVLFVSVLFFLSIEMNAQTNKKVEDLRKLKNSFQQKTIRVL